MGHYDLGWISIPFVIIKKNLFIDNGNKFSIMYLVHLFHKSWMINKMSSTQYNHLIKYTIVWQIKNITMVLYLITNVNFILCTCIINWHIYYILQKLTEIFITFNNAKDVLITKENYCLCNSNVAVSIIYDQ